MFLVSSVVWLVEFHDDYMFKPVQEWSNEDVLQWMRGLGESVKRDCMETFEKEVHELILHLLIGTNFRFICLSYTGLFLVQIKGLPNC